MYAARTRNGFTLSSRQALLKKFEGLEITQCPFANLPEARSGRWGQGLTAEKKRLLRPVFVRQFEFLEWTPDRQLRQSKFVALRDNNRRNDAVRNDLVEDHD